MWVISAIVFDARILTLVALRAAMLFAIILSLWWTLALTMFQPTMALKIRLAI
jgi:hypothetical protein